MSRQFRTYGLRRVEDACNPSSMRPQLGVAGDQQVLHDKRVQKTRNTTFSRCSGYDVATGMYGYPHLPPEAFRNFFPTLTPEAQYLN